MRIKFSILTDVASEFSGHNRNTVHNCAILIVRSKMHQSSDEDNGPARRKRNAESGKPPLPPGSPRRLKAAVPGIDVASLPISPSSSARTTPRLDSGNSIEFRIMNYLNSAIENMVKQFSSDLRAIVETDHSFSLVVDSFKNDLLSSVKAIVKLPEDRFYATIDTDVYEFVKEMRKAEKAIQVLHAKKSPPSLEETIENMGDVHEHVSSQFDENTTSKVCYSESCGTTRRKEIQLLEQKRVLLGARVQAIKQQNQRLQEELKHMRSIERLRQESLEDYDEVVGSIKDLRRTIRSLKHGVHTNVRWTRNEDLGPTCEALYSATLSSCDQFVDMYNMMLSERSAARLKEQELINMMMSRQIRTPVFA